MRYPVKSLAGESLTSVQIAQGGIPLDRRYAVIDRSEKLDGKQLTARRNAALLSFQARVASDQAVMVRTPSGSTRSIEDPRFAAELQDTLGQPVTIERAQGENFHDAHDVLVLSAASLRALEAQWQAAINPLRFRPNIIIDGDGLAPFEETQWVGSTFQAGTATLAAAALCERCVLTTIDPETLVKSPSFLKLIVEEHAACFGVYCRVQNPGLMSVGDPWTICR